MGTGTRAAALLVLVMAVGTASGQATCKEYNTTLSDGSLGFCTGIVDYKYLGQVGQSQEDLETIAVSTLFATPSAANVLQLLPSTCTTQLKKQICMSVFPKCVVVPSDVLSGTNVVGYLVPDEATCALGGGEWDDEFNICGAALPQFPCREVCNKAGSSNVDELERACPLVSGLFGAQVAALTGSPNAQFAAEATAILAGCTGPVCRYSLNVLQAFGFANDCTGTIPSGALALDLFPDGEQSNLALQGMKTAIGSAVDCGPAGATDSVPCSHFLQVVECQADRQDVLVEDSIALADDSNICLDVLRDDANQDVNVLGALAGQEAALQAPQDRAQCFNSGVADTKRSAYFVPPAPGATPLGQRVDSDGVERQLDDTNEAACPAQVPLPSFANLEAEAPLCTSQVRPGVVGYNSRDCNLIQVEDAFAQFPTATTARCRAAFSELVCSTAHMKVELKELCLIPSEDGGCVSDNSTQAVLESRIPLVFALPRFPSKAICETFNAECASYIALAPQLGQNCSAIVDITSCSGPAQFWGCSSSLNGVPQYPDTNQVFLNVATEPALSVYETSVNSIPTYSLTLQPAFATSVVLPTVSEVLTDPNPSDEDLGALGSAFCVCPDPLVAPDDPLGTEPLNSLTCCALPCLGTMLTSELMGTYGLIQFPLSIISLLLATFMVITWGAFKEKRKQYMTFWMSVSSFMVALSFFILAATEDFNLENSLCLDNSTPQTQEQGFNRTVFTAAVLIFFAQSLCAWWLVQAVDLYRKLVRGSRDSTEASKIKYHVFAWFFPLVSVSYVISQEGLGFSAPTPWGLMTLGGDIEWLSFYAFIAFCFVVGSACMFSVLLMIYRHSRKTRRLQTSDSGAGKFAIYRTPLYFVAIFVLVWMEIFSFRASQSFQEDRIREAGEAWVGCLLTNALGGIPDPATNPLADLSTIADRVDADQQGCGETQPDGINLVTLGATFVIVNIQGILVFIIFGYSSQNRHLWRKRLGFKTVASSYGSRKTGNSGPGTPHMATTRAGSFAGSSLNLSTAEPQSPKMAKSPKPASPASFSYSFVESGTTRPPSGAPPAPPSDAPPSAPPPSL